MTVGWKPPSSSVRLLQHYPLPSSSSSPLLGGEQINYAHDCHSDLRLVGSCRGLICILTDKKYFTLLNPSTRETKELPPVLDLQPPSQYDVFIGKYGYICRFGFAFNEQVHDYLVYADVAMPHKHMSRVYSLKSDSWKNFRSVRNREEIREVVNQMIPYSVGDWGRFASGKLHWHVKKDMDPGQPMPITAIDPNAPSVMHVVDQPPADVDEPGGFNSSRLGVLDGCLCEQRFYRNKNQLDVWVRNDHVWTKRFSISPPPPCRPLFHPISTLPNGEVLFLNSYNCGLVIYNPRENKVIYQASTNSQRFYGVALYVESLVSLVPDPDCQ